jgi:hypothetical protein
MSETSEPKDAGPLHRADWDLRQPLGEHFRTAVERALNVDLQVSGVHRGSGFGSSRRNSWCKVVHDGSKIMRAAVRKRTSLLAHQSVRSVPQGGSLVTLQEGWR